MTGRKGTIPITNASRKENSKTKLKNNCKTRTTTTTKNKTKQNKQITTPNQELLKAL